MRLFWGLSRKELHAGSHLRALLVITCLLLGTQAAAQPAQVRLRDELEREEVYRSRDNAQRQRNASQQSRSKSRGYQDKAKEAEAVAEAYQALADAERQTADKADRQADRSEERRRDWDRLSIKGETIYAMYAEACFDAGTKGESYLESCIAYHIVREIGYHSCLRFQGLSDAHEYRGRHCYGELKHAVTKCLNRQYRAYDFVSCVRKAGHFPYFFVNAEGLREEPEELLEMRHEATPKTLPGAQGQ